MFCFALFLIVINCIVFYCIVFFIYFRLYMFCKTDVWCSFLLELYAKCGTSSKKNEDKYVMGIQHSLPTFTDRQQCLAGLKWEGGYCTVKYCIPETTQTLKKYRDMTTGTGTGTLSPPCISTLYYCTHMMLNILK